MKELPEILRDETEERVEGEAETQEMLEAYLGPYLEIPTIHKIIAAREGIYERIQAEMHHEDKEEVVMVEEMLKAWSEVPELMLET